MRQWPTEAQEGLRLIERAIQLGSDFQLIVVECDSVKNQRLAMKALWPRVRYRLAEVKDATRPVIDQVVEQVGSGSTPVMVTGLEHLAFPGSEELGMWQNLNITRPRWVRELPRTVIFWVTEDAHRLLATRAPDLYRFRSTAIDLRLPKSDADERVTELRERIRTIKATPVTKLRWITELWQITKERAALDGLLNEAMKKGGSLPADALKALTYRKKLVINDRAVFDLSPLAGLFNLKDLSFRSTQVFDLSPLSGLTNLEQLDCTEAKISSLSPLSGLINLKNLSFRSTQVFDLSPLSGLTNLEQLDCTEAKISNLSPLAGLFNLKSVFSEATPVSDLGPLSELTKLEQLNFAETDIFDLSPISELHNLQEFECRDTWVNDLGPLAKLTSLKKLSCRNTPVSGLNHLHRLTNLQLLLCTGTQVTREEIVQLEKALPNCKIISDFNRPLWKTFRPHPRTSKTC